MKICLFNKHSQKFSVKSPKAAFLVGENFEKKKDEPSFPLPAYYPFFSLGGGPMAGEYVFFSMLPFIAVKV